MTLGISFPRKKVCTACKIVEFERIVIIGNIFGCVRNRLEYGNFVLKNFKINESFPFMLLKT